MELLLLLLIFFVLFPLLKVLFSVGRTVHTFKKAFNQQSQQYHEAKQQQAQQTEKGSRKERARAYFKNASEDAEFEEIKADRKVPNDAGRSTDGNSSDDSRITDAQYEDVK